MRALFPEIKPYQTEYLELDSVHQIYVEQCGNPQGLPVLVVHGGPGAGCSAMLRRYFDPERYRIILFDQRGAGLSKPHAELEANNTDLLLADMEHIRQHLAVEQWVLFGGSWGSTLSLLYAQLHPELVQGLILRGIFLARQKDIDWLYSPGGANRLFPDEWQKLTKQLPEQTKVLEHYHELLTGPDELKRMAAAKHWSSWEAHCSTLKPNKQLVDSLESPHVATALARIEAHYFIHKCFIEENQILNNAERLSGIPGTIVHGRYDVVCPLDQAFALHERWPDSELEIIREAGHSSMDPAIADALVKATEEFADRYFPKQPS